MYLLPVKHTEKQFKPLSAGTFTSVYFVCIHNKK